MKIRTKTDLAQAINYLRSNKALTLKELSANSGVCLNTIYNIEANRKSPNIENLLKILNALGATLSID